MKPWWKWPLALSIGWFAILVVLSLVGASYISNDNHPGATLSQDARFEKLGQVAGRCWCSACLRFGGWPWSGIGNAANSCRPICRNAQHRAAAELR